MDNTIIKKLDPVISYLHSLVRNYAWSKNYQWSTNQQWNDLERMLKEVESRKNDPKLYLGIVGEFSSGKSTFINALLRMNLLKEGTMQGTTCSPTLLSKEDKFDVTVYANHGKTVSFKSQSASPSNWNGIFQAVKGFFGSWKKSSITDQVSKEYMEAKAFIDLYTANEAYSNSVDKVCIGLPISSRILDDQIVIVDTPGISTSSHPRHSEVTIRVLRELCDISIILTPGPAPCSGSLIDFVNEHLKELVCHTIILATKIDEVHASERAQTIGYIKERIENETGGKLAGIYGIDAKHVIRRDDTDESEMSERKRNDLEMLRNQFLQTENDIVGLLQKSRTAIIFQKLQSMLGGFCIPVMQNIINNITVNIEAGREKLINNKLCNYDEFISGALAHCKSQLKEVCRDNNSSRKLDRLYQKIQTQMDEYINSASDVSSLRSLISQSSLSEIFDSYQGNVNNIIQNICGPISRQLNELLTDFHEEFNRQYRDLASSASVIRTSSSSVGYISGTSISVSNEMSAETINRDVGVGVGVCAVVGQIICPIPVVGAVLGGIVGASIGALFNSMFGKSMDEYRQEARSSFIQALDSWYDQVSYSVEQEIESYRKQCYKQLKSRIASYENYRPSIESIIMKEQQQLERYQQTLTCARKDFDQLLLALNFVKGQRLR